MSALPQQEILIKATSYMGEVNIVRRLLEALLASITLTVWYTKPEKISLIDPGNGVCGNPGDVIGYPKT